MWLKLYNAYAGAIIVGVFKNSCLGANSATPTIIAPAHAVNISIYFLIKP